MLMARAELFDYLQANTFLPHFAVEWFASGNADAQNRLFFMFPLRCLLPGPS